MLVQQIHEYIWGHVIDEINKGHHMVGEGEYVVKREAIDMLTDMHEIDDQAADILYENNYCVLCSLYIKCSQCPLYNGWGSCGDPWGLYKQACRGDLEAAERIKAIDVLSGTNPIQHVIDDLEHVRRL